MSPLAASEKPRMRMSSSPPSAAWKLMPAVLCSASFSVSRRRSSISFSVTMVTDCGMSRSACWPLPMVVVLARTEVASVSGRPLTEIGCSVVSFLAPGEASAAADADADAAGASGCACIWAWTWACACANAEAPSRPKPAARAPSGSIFWGGGFGNVTVGGGRRVGALRGMVLFLLWG